MPTEGTKRQGFRYPADKWKRFAEAAIAAGTNPSDLLQNFIDWSIGEPRARAPKKLKLPTTEGQ